MPTYLLIIIAVAAVIVIWLVGSYNSLIRCRNRTRESWSDSDVQLNRRYHLIPTLVYTVTVDAPN